jgi:hypothetical protein
MSVALSNDGKYLLMGNFDGTTILWNAATGEELCEMVAFVNGDWAVIDADGRYNASNPDKMEELYWVVGDEAVELARFKDRFFEPALLAKKMGFSKEPLRSVPR